ncbi:MAG TPA: DNA polymerase I, partial [Candidatus Goldiibacteriota bacterium]|nr:DNA polymerase I [Candidatus Goldiibacteriota bacterium]
SDKDMIQIVNDNVYIYKIGKDRETILTPENVKEKYGIEPHEIVDVLALMGDSSDNIPGVKGIGEKTAIKLVKQYKNVDNILQNVDEIKPEKIRESIKQSTDIIKLSRKLAILNIDDTIPDRIGFSLDKCSIDNINRDLLENEFLRYNFKSLISDNKIINQEAGMAAMPAGNIFSFNEIAEEIQKQKTIALFFMGNERKPELLIIGFENQAYYIFGKDFKTIPDCFYKKNIVTNSAKTIFFHSNGQNAGTIYDLMLISYILHSEKTYRDVSHVFTEYLGGNYLSYDDVSGKGAKKVSIENVDKKILSLYAGSVVKASFLILPELTKKIKVESLENVYYDIELPLAKVLCIMEKTGLKIDVNYLNLLIEKFNSKINELEKSIYEKAGCTFNLNSPKQLSDVLFNKLNLQKVKKIKTGFSTNNEVLLMLQNAHPVVQEIINYRTFSKIKTSFLDVILNFTDENSKIFPYYNQTVAATGRLSSSEPNIQNIPVRDEEGREIRKVFIPLNKGDIIIKADYSQIELRILAHFSNDEKLMEYFLSDKDIHTMTAAEIFGINEKDVIENQRRVAKTINFGIIYGMSSYGMSRELKIPLKQAAFYIEKFFQTYKNVRKYQEEMINFAQKNGYVETLLGRKRYVPDINSSNKTMREFAERIAINSPIQGTAADVIKKAMIEIVDLFIKDKLKSKMILQVHDELVFSVNVEEKEKIKTEVKRIMENVIKLNVPLKIKTGEGKNWYECG